MHVVQVFYRGAHVAAKLWWVFADCVCLSVSVSVCWVSCVSSLSIRTCGVYVGAFSTTQRWQHSIITQHHAASQCYSTDAAAAAAAQLCCTIHAVMLYERCVMCWFVRWLQPFLNCSTVAIKYSRYNFRMCIQPPNRAAQYFSIQRNHTCEPT